MSEAIQASAPRLVVTVDRRRCCGYAICVGICPEVYELDGDGLAQVRPGSVRLELHEPARRAAASCPEEAITVRVEA